MLTGAENVSARLVERSTHYSQEHSCDGVQQIKAESAEAMEGVERSDHSVMVAVEEEDVLLDHRTVPVLLSPIVLGATIGMISVDSSVSTALCGALNERLS